MRLKMNHFIVQWVSAAAALASTPSMACSLVPVDPLLLKQAMAKEIAYRLGVKVEQIRLDDITAPELQRPFELGADCSGLWAYHHISGFRIERESLQYVVKRLIDPTYRTAGGAGKRARSRLAAGPWPWWVGPSFRGRPRGAPIFAPGTIAAPPDIQAQNDYIAGFQASGISLPTYSREPPYIKGGIYVRGDVSAPIPMRWPQYPREEDFLLQDSVQQEPTWSFMQMPPLSPPAPPAAAQTPGCIYEGVAAILGYGESSPVAVNFMNSCDRP